MSDSKYLEVQILAKKTAQLLREDRFVHNCQVLSPDLNAIGYILHKDTTIDNPKISPVYTTSEFYDKKRHI